MNTATTRIANLISMTGGVNPSITLENRFKTAAVTYDGKRKEFMKTVTQRVAVRVDLYDRLVKDVKIGDQIEATINTLENVNTLEDYRVVHS